MRASEVRPRISQQRRADLAMSHSRVCVCRFVYVGSVSGGKGDRCRKKKNSNSNQFGVVAALAQTPDLGFGRWAESDERAACFLSDFRSAASTWAPKSCGLGVWDWGLDPRVGVRLR